MYTPYHSQYSARGLLMQGSSEDSVAKSLSSARVDMKPHQVDAALFALHSPLSKGVILADEVGLGKTIEASLVIAQRWAERRRRILLIVPASLRKQWAQELHDKFGITSVIVDARNHSATLKAGGRPFEVTSVAITSYEFAAGKAPELAGIVWDLVVIDEAHRLRNVHRASGAARARRLRRALSGRYKLLLTATPLQNSLMELYGLVSMIDEEYFGGEAAFRALYDRRGGAAMLADLRLRLKPLYMRHLRRDVQEAGHVAFTRRQVVTFDFAPADQEIELYERVSAYLQRPSTVAFGSPPSPLVLTVARKVLGSSTAAVGRFLETVLGRLRRHRATTLADLADIDDADTLAAEHREAGDGEDDEDAGGADLLHADLGCVEEEIAEVEASLALTRRIGSNVKGDLLVAKLPELLEAVERNGGFRKVVVFTESVRTQMYLAAILARGGFAGGIVLLNGSNADPDSKVIYERWLERHRGTDRVSGSKGADMKAAIVEAFRRDEGTILIATESGAEGINLQFCSLLVNFDLPWNPQRIEQRIGRCHRYGQRLDVTVINFLNLKNQVEARVQELLARKFHLFEGVFGASDGVLGSIASGVDFERDVLRIAQDARSDTEIEEAFATLAAKLDARIAADMASAHRRLLDAMDHDVVAKLRGRDEAVSRLMDDVSRRLLVVARAELPDARFEPDAGPHFEVDGTTWTTDWAAAADRGWRFFRLGEGGFGTSLVERAAERELPAGAVAFDRALLRATGVPGYADVDRLAGQAGWLRVSRVTLDTAAEVGAPREAFVIAAVTDGNEPLHPETVDRLLLVPGEHLGPPRMPAPDDRLDFLEREHLAIRIEEAKAQNVIWLREEDERSDALTEDLARAADEEIRALDAEIRAAKLASRDGAVDAAERIKANHRILDLESARDELQFKSFARKRTIRMEARQRLDRLEASLAVEPVLTRMFTIRWTVSA